MADWAPAYAGDLDVLGRLTARPCERDLRHSCSCTTQLHVDEQRSLAWTGRRGLQLPLVMITKGLHLGVHWEQNCVWDAFATFKRLANAASRVGLYQGYCWLATAAS